MFGKYLFRRDLKSNAAVAGGSRGSRGVEPPQIVGSYSILNKMSALLTASRQSELLNCRKKV